MIVPMAENSAITASSPMASGSDDRRLRSLLYRTLTSEGPLLWGGDGPPPFPLPCLPGSLNNGAPDKPVSSSEGIGAQARWTASISEKLVSQLESYEGIPGADTPVCCALTMALASDRAHFLALPRVGRCCSASTRACCGVGTTLLLVLRPTDRRLVLEPDQLKRLEQRPLVLQPDILAFYRRDFGKQTDRVLPIRLALGLALGLFNWERPCSSQSHRS